MAPGSRDIPWLGRDFFENQRKFPLDELMRYAGQYVAWSFDGARIVASDPDEASLYRKLKDAGVESWNVVVGWIDWSDKAIF